MSKRNHNFTAISLQLKPWFKTPSWKSIYRKPKKGFTTFIFHQLWIHVPGVCKVMPYSILFYMYMPWKYSWVAHRSFCGRPSHPAKLWRGECTRRCESCVLHSVQESKHCTSCLPWLSWWWYCLPRTVRRIDRAPQWRQPPLRTRAELHFRCLRSVRSRLLAQPTWLDPCFPTPAEPVTKLYFYSKMLSTLLWAVLTSASESSLTQRQAARRL